MVGDSDLSVIDGSTGALVRTEPLPASIAAAAPGQQGCVPGAHVFKNGAAVPGIGLVCFYAQPQNLACYETSARTWLPLFNCLLL